MTLQQIKSDRNALVQVLTEAGAEFVGQKIRCLFHDDKHPSAGIYCTDSGDWRFRCHVCDWSGDAIDILQRVHGESF